MVCLLKSRWNDIEYSYRWNIKNDLFVKENTNFQYIARQRHRGWRVSRTISKIKKKRRVSNPKKENNSDKRYKYESAPKTLNPTPTGYNSLKINSLFGNFLAEKTYWRGLKYYFPGKIIENIQTKHYLWGLYAITVEGSRKMKRSTCFFRPYGCGQPWRSKA